MSSLAESFVQRESQDEEVVGVVVFGSFAQGRVGERSDLDLLVVEKNLDKWTSTRRRVEGIDLEIYRWPLEPFSRPFLGIRGDTYLDAFLFRVIRTGKVLYDPKRTLGEFKRYAETHKLPSSHVKWLADKANESLHFARKLLGEEELEGAELKARRAAEELAGAVLLERDILDIRPPKCYLPRLRDEVPEFYVAFREVHNLGKVRRNTITAAISGISEWRDRVAEELRESGREEWLKLEGAISGAQTELSNARDCLEMGDLEAAALQTRYSAILVASSIARMLRGKTWGDPSMRIVELLRSDHPYGDVLRLVMGFSRDEQRIKEHVAILEDEAKRFTRKRFPL